MHREVQARGWTVQRIKVDDGCYQVRGTDRLGNKVKAKFALSHAAHTQSGSRIRPERRCLGLSAPAACGR
ncbi:PepSY domain-containing protein [Massilia sp. H-1]|nr:PepSY domain-containing protein [Massilia sp. H-1]